MVGWLEGWDGQPTSSGAGSSSLAGRSGHQRAKALVLRPRLLTSHPQAYKMATRTMAIRVASAFKTTSRRAWSSPASPYLVAPCLAGPSSCPAPRPAHRQRQPLATPPRPPRRRYATKANNSDGDDDDQSIRAQWAKDLLAHRSNLIVSKSRRETLPKSIFDVTFTRSSGAGGQHVNKVSTKANVRVSLAAASAANAASVSGVGPFPLPIPKEVIGIAAKESVSLRRGGDVVPCSHSWCLVSPTTYPPATLSS